MSHKTASTVALMFGLLVGLGMWLGTTVWENSTHAVNGIVASHAVALTSGEVAVDVDGKVDAYLLNEDQKVVQQGQTVTVWQTGGTPSMPPLSTVGKLAVTFGAGVGCWIVMLLILTLVFSAKSTAYQPYRVTRGIV